ncbi:AMP-binding protein [Pseudonocardia kunmingensis]|uniref:Acyl-CoA synthetase (AMP-forming)/AMP-acid ligase II n=1 Tax=Pseudonocardia kunmingensis TaxID=630975 RepID=A0A543DPU2_9PSEU|nr:AMP-binding protein [Pseudonocardia kunmingensis]TQM11323.1 acyl-CoA synthetase (AMP-forming)/AMP-acid ligase II [Pseudonocardia kunmingensis]
MTGEAMTLISEIERGASAHSAVPVVFASTERPASTTLGELVGDAERVAGALQGLGIGPGDVVAVQMPNVYEGAVAQTAVALCGAVLLPIVQIYGPRELGFILRQSGARAIVVPGVWRGRDHAAVVAGLGDLPGLRAVIVADEQVPDGAVAFSDLTGRLAKPYSRPEVRPADRAMLVYTSGTTADPKGVQHSHASLLAEVHSPLMLRDGVGEAKHLAVFPSGHVAGLLGLLRILVHGNETVVLDVWHPARAAALVDEHQVTSGVGAPVHLAGLLDERDRGAVTLESLREFMVGAAGVPPSLVQRADRAGIAAYRCYGSSEHPTISSGATSDPLHKRATTDGRVIGGSEVRLVDDDGVDVASGAEGEIVTRGGELFLGYTDPALDEGSFLPEGWFRTGDIGRFDDEGYLTITDRKKDIIVRGGENISSKEVEDVLAQHPAVAEAIAVGKPDDRYGERVCAVVVLHDPAGSLDLDEVARHFAEAGVARQKTPEHLVVLDELPRTAAGKVQKYVLRERVRG